MEIETQVLSRDCNSFYIASTPIVSGSTAAVLCYVNTLRFMQNPPHAILGDV